MTRRLFSLLTLAALGFTSSAISQDQKDTIRVGMIGLDTSHALAFTKILADPANAYGALVKWPEPRDAGGQLQRTAGASVLIDAPSGRLLAYLAKSSRRLVTFPAECVEDQPHADQLIAQRLGKLAETSGPVLLDRIDAAPVGDSPLTVALRQAGFVSTSRGYLHRGVGRTTRLDAMAARRDPEELSDDTRELK